MPQVWAASYIGYTASNLGGNTCGTNCDSTGSTTQGIGQTFQSPFTSTSTIVAVGLYTGSAVPDRVIIATYSITPTLTSTSCGGAGTCAFVPAGISATVRDVETLTGMSANAFNTVNLASPPTITANQWVTVLFMLTTSGTAKVLMQIGTGAVGTTGATLIDFSTTNPTIGNSYTTGAPPCCDIVGASFQVGTTGTNAVTQCYGNCGTPPITLANTNSTHTVNFNQSITLFYLFQSNLNGFLVNVTANLARSYSDGLHFVFLGIYTATCPIGQTPFTSQCPGQEILGGSTVTQTKGRASLNAGNAYPVTNGMWIGLAFTGVISGIDLNDTNTQVNVQVTNGQLPAIITQYSQYQAAFKMGLWAWITGNVITVAPPTLPGTGYCAQLDCLLTALVNSFCSNLTPGCQSGSALMWAFILTIIFETVLAAGLSRGVPNMKVPFGELFMILFLGWLFIMSGLSLVIVFVPVFFILVVSILFSKHTGRYF